MGQEISNPGRRALITGVTGQIGSYLAELLLKRGYEVHGIVRRNSFVGAARSRIDHLGDLKLHHGDICDASSLNDIIHRVRPDEVYNLAAQSHVWISFQVPEHTCDVDALGALRVCDAARRMDKPVRVYQASTSELFGGIYNYPVNEETPFHPRSPYGVAKQFAHWTMINHREAYGMFCSNGIVFNSESPRRGENFVTRKITKELAAIVRGKKEKMFLGNLNARRDWNHAKDSAESMRLILQAEKPGDYVIASGEANSVREFAEMAFRCAGIELGWRGEGLDEVGYDVKTGRERIGVNPFYFRPSEVDVLIGDSSKAKKELGWKPSYSFGDIVEEMVEYDLNGGNEHGSFTSRDS